jgi:hypothetical protein
VTNPMEAATAVTTGIAVVMETAMETGEGIRI